MLTGRPGTQAASTLQIMRYRCAHTGHRQSPRPAGKLYCQAGEVLSRGESGAHSGAPDSRGRRGNGFTESTVIEFGTPREVLFSSTLPLEFADMLRLQNSDGTLDAEASVVALQYTSGRTAVAARFTQEVSNWIVKP